MRRHLATTLFAITLATSGVSLAAQLSPARIALDEAATLRLDADDGTMPTPPTVGGLHFRQAGQSTQMSIVNGAMSRHTTVDYEVVADRAGTYSFSIDGQPMSLVVDASGRSTRGAPQQPSAAQPAAQDDAIAFMRVVLPTRKVYVGQSIPVTFKAYFRAGTEVTLTGAPSLGIPAFTVGQLPADPKQSVENIGGVPYRVATWTGDVSAAMPGHYETSATLPIVARYREASRAPVRDPFGGMLDDQDPFGASAMQSFFSRAGLGMGDPFGRVRERELTVRAHVQGVEVLPLPSVGRPADFSGAVGSFDIRARLGSDHGSTFEPMSLHLDISGRGNLDRVSTSGVLASPEWKTYPPSAGTIANGTKTFEQAVVPEAAGRVELPSVSFSFFDPERGQYVTRTTSPIPVTVARTADTATGTAAPTTSPTTSPTELRPDHTDLGAVASLVPPYRRAWFWMVFAAPIVGLLSRRRVGRSIAERAGRRSRTRTVAARREEMKRAAVAADTARYFVLARSAVQERLGSAWHVAPEEVTAAEVQQRVGVDGAPLADALRIAEDLLYAGVVPRIESLPTYDRTLERELDQWEARS